MATVADLAKLRERVDTIVARHDAATAAVDLGQYRGRIEAFASEVLHVTVLTDTQRAHLRSAVENARTAAYGANGCGKTFDDAIIAMYLIYVENYLVIATSAKEAQLRDQFMRDIRRLFSQAPGLPGTLYTMQLRRSDDPESGLLCMAAGSSDNLRSFHAPRVCVQLQEAQGLPDFAFESAEMMSVGAFDKVTLTGNTTQTGGAFHRRCLSPQWIATRFNSEDHPNIIENRTVIAGGPTRESRAQRAADYGVDSPFFVASWLGLFPSVSVEGLIRLEWLEAAYARHENNLLMRAEPRPLVSLDVARSLDRDQSCAAVVQGNRVHSLTAWHSRDLEATVDRFLAIAEEARRDWFVAATLLPPEELMYSSAPKLGLVIDAPGVGSGCVDSVRRRGRIVEEYWGWSPARDTKKYQNVRAENFWHLRTLLERGECALPRDPLLNDEALAIEWTLNPQGQVQIGSKEALRERLGRSCDRLDSCVMGLAATSNRYAWKQVQCSWN